MNKLEVLVYQALFSLIPIPNEQSVYSVIVREGYFFGFHTKEL